MELTHDDVLEILEVLDRANVGYLELDVAGTRLVADWTGAGVTEFADRWDGADGRATPAAAADTSARTDPPVAVPEQPESREADVCAGENVQAGAGAGTAVTAPVVGVFYRAPEPGAPPFVEVGDEVGEDTTVGLVEVMKMFNSVTAGVRGVVIEVLVENEAFVEYGQSLMTIRPT